MENNMFVSFSPIEQQQPVFDIDEIEYNNINLPYSDTNLGIGSGQTSFAPENPYDQLLNNISTQQTQTTSTQQSDTSVSGSALDRGVYIAKRLAEKGGFTKEQAAAIAGTMMDENKCDPSSYMKAEKAGKGAKGTDGNGYGAGIGSWTGALKQRVLAQAGYSPNTRIEDLSMDQQIDILIKDTQTGNKKYYDALRRCKTIEDASATSVPSALSSPVSPWFASMTASAILDTMSLTALIASSFPGITQSSSSGSQFVSAIPIRVIPSE